MNSQQHINSENDPTIKSTVIISVYKDAESLDLILPSNIDHGNEGIIIN